MLLVKILNDGSGSEADAAYECEVLVSLTRVLWRRLAAGRIAHHDRKDGWRVLLRRVADELPAGDGAVVASRIEPRDRSEDIDRDAVLAHVVRAADEWARARERAAERHTELRARRLERAEAELCAAVTELGRSPRAPTSTGRRDAPRRRRTRGAKA